MTKIQSNNNDLIIRDVPASKWATGVIVIIVSFVFVYLFLGARINSESAVDYLFMLVPAGWGLYVLATTGITTTVINKQMRHVTVTKRGILRNNYDNLAFDKVVARAYVKEIPGRGTRYSLRLPLEGERHIELAADRMLGSKKLYNLADQTTITCGRSTDRGISSRQFCPRTIYFD